VIPDEAAAGRPPGAIKMRALVAAALLVAILLVILQATPPFASPEPPPSVAAPFFDKEPEIRVRIGTLEPGQEAVVTGIDGWTPGGVKVANRGGKPEIAGEPCDMPCVMMVKKDGELGLGDRRYHGDLVVVREPETSRVHLVNRLGIELYLEGVVLSEMPADYPDEALYAQAIASRSYAAWQILVRKDRIYDVTDTQRSQVYKGAPAQLELARRVVANTRGRVLTHGGKVLEAVFSSTCGGATRSAQEAFGDESPAPLRGVTCGLCDGTQFSTWTARVKRADAGRTLALGGPIEEVSASKVHQSGRLAQVTLLGPKGQKTLTGNQFRDLFGAAGRSTWFTRIELSGDWLVVDGRGFGHGVGMCQVGASKLASAARGHLAILAHYYPDAVIGLLYPVHES
jgi:stage II sporulation protein D